ncbi:peptide/nickel transport system substrate-binding protein [Palleronia aestuarii]|uniref:Peptide/nickel transport system substrate-binding protein n=1 Tax=Palleronia aestuarii TaxID=568105 RepID=A0A2W7NTF4_9RHOB|nr:ABC transporter substrate-binding protein [Palleronia aestuarii]PZX14512.1 peptide/nickel transport system substrate-binding protein [Palleronia aestuarii]
MSDTDHERLARLAEAARRGHISRRNFMHYALAAGVTATTATGLWTRKAAAQPKSGGTFRWALHDGATTANHDPATYLTKENIFLAHTHRSYLTMIMGDGSLGPDLAESWEANDDATVWTFSLNPNAGFHSGRPVTAEDVVDSINHHRGEDTASAAKPLLADISDVKADGEQAIVFTLSRGNADLPWLMTDFHLAICPSNGDGSIDWQSGDGSGPYQIESGEWGVQFNLTRFDGWHGEGAWFDRVEIITLNDPNARQTALVTGDVDAVSLIELRTMGLLQRDPNIVIHNIPSGAAITMPMFCDQAPYDNVDVRNALKLAMNRDEIIEKITFGASTKANDFQHSPALPYYPEGIEQRAYDPEEARFLLKRAGAENLTVDLSTSDVVYAGAVDMAVLYAEQAREAGINVNVVREPNDGYYSDVWLKKPFSVVSWGARPTPDVIYTIAYKDDAPWNESHWQNERFNELLVIAKAELDQGLRAEMYHEMAMLARDDGGTIIPFFNNFVYANRANVGTPEELAPSWENDGARAASRWWFTD